MPWFENQWLSKQQYPWLFAQDYTLEYETIRYFLNAQNSGTPSTLDPFTVNNNIRALKSGSSISFSSVMMNVSTTAGSAFISNPSVDLRPYIGFKITLSDGGVGWMRAVNPPAIMSYKTSPLSAPLAVMVPVQPNAALTQGDVLSYGRGTAIVGYNYDCANTYQGSRICLFEPLYTGGDSKGHYPWLYGSISYLLKNSANRVQVASHVTGTPYAQVNTSFNLLERQLLIARQDCDNPISGGSYIDLWLNGVQTVGTTSAGVAILPETTAYLGSNATGASAGHLLYAAMDLDYVLSAAEISALGTGTAPVSPDRVILHPEGIKFGWLPGARAASGNLTTGSNTNEAFFWNKRAYNSGTNPYGNWIVNGGFETALGAEWVASASATLTKSTTTAHLVGMFDTSVLTVTNNGGVNQSATQTVTASAGTSFYFSVWTANVDATSADVNVYSGTAGAPTATLVFSNVNNTTTSTKASGCFSVATGHDRITIVLTATGADTKIVRFDNVDMHQNLVANGGMEGTFAKTGSALHASTAATTTYDATGAYDATAWTLTNAVVGMIVEAADGKYGFITEVAANHVHVDAWVGGTPADGQAASVYSAIAPGWSAAAGAKLYRTTGATGSYAQGVADSDGNNKPIQNITVVAGTWYWLSVFVKAVSGSAIISFGSSGSGGNNTITTVGTSFTRISVMFRATTNGASTFGLWCNDSAFIVDDAFAIPLSSVTLTATPYSQNTGVTIYNAQLTGTQSWISTGSTPGARNFNVTITNN